MSTAVSRNRRSIAGTFALIFLAIAGLSVIDGFLAREERLESYREAEELFAEGLRYEQAGNYSQAIDRFRGALSVRGGQEHYAAVLAGALLKAGRVPQAQSVLMDVLQRDSISGEANLVMARAFVKQDKIARAESYYHHAIYDRWPENAASHRVQARLELIQLLARHNRRQELLSELLALQNDAGADTSTLKRIAPLYLTAGSPGHAVEAFREILRSDPRKAEAHEGVGDAEFMLRNYQAAEEEFQNALRLDSGKQELQARLELCRRILHLDPNRRGLSMRDRYQRSIELLKLVLNDLRQCGTDAASPGVGDLIGSGEEQLQRRASASQEDDAIEANLSLAEKLWRARKADCKQTVTPYEKALDLALARISR